MDSMSNNLLLRARRAFLPFHGVVGVGYGPKLTHGKAVTRHSIVVFVEKKLPIDEVREGERIPSTFEKVLTDVRVPKLMLTRNGPRDRCLSDYHWLDMGKIDQMWREQRAERTSK